jgi:hypothetical protein
MIIFLYKGLNLVVLEINQLFEIYWYHLLAINIFRLLDSVIKLDLYILGWFSVVYWCNLLKIDTQWLCILLTGTYIKGFNWKGLMIHNQVLLI